MGLGEALLQDGEMFFSAWLVRGEGEAVTGGSPVHPSLPGALKPSQHMVHSSAQQDGADSQRVGVKSHLQLEASELGPQNLIYIL